MSTEDVKQTAQDVVLSLTGYDEIAIEKEFGAELESLTGQRSMRALAFVLIRREDQSGRRQSEIDRDAYDQVMRTSQQAVMEMFGVDFEELMADEPESEAGKGDSLSESGQPA